VKKAFKIIGLVVLVLIVLFASFILFMRSTMHPGQGPALPGNVHQVVDSFVNCYLLEAGDEKKQLVMVDAGADTKGVQILQTLKAMGRGPEDVTAIFLTHSHQDHVAGLGLFPKALVFALQTEAGLADGSEAYHSPISLLGGRRNKHPFHLTRGLKDEETVNIGKFSITAYGVPGHTAGSAAYLASGVLFLGDAANATKDGRLEGTMWFFSGSQGQGALSLKDLAIRLKPRAEEIKFITTAHGGNLAGFGALERF
jgi:glyoxylase-like metal-dependent hydrolase (beta-lactamase superfamily II)